MCTINDMQCCREILCVARNDKFNIKNKKVYLIVLFSFVMGGLTGLCRVLLLH